MFRKEHQHVFFLIAPDGKNEKGHHPFGEASFLMYSFSGIGDSLLFPLFYIPHFQQVFGDLYGVQRRSFFNLIADGPESQSVWIR